jgi:hypothetical protein
MLGFIAFLLISFLPGEVPCLTTLTLTPHPHLYPFIPPPLPSLCASLILIPLKFQLATLKVIFFADVTW